MQHQGHTAQSRSSNRALYQYWLKAFNASFITHNNRPNELEQHALAMLHIRRLDVYFAVYGPGDNELQLNWDKYMPEFVEMLTHASAAAATFPVTSSFVLGGGFILPLCRLVRRCRDPRIRRTAMKILRCLRRRDGVMEGRLAARVLGRIVEIEEHGLGQITSCEDVPEAARVTGVLVRFLGRDKGARLIYHRTEDIDGSRVMVEESLDGGDFEES